LGTRFQAVEAGLGRTGTRTEYFSVEPERLARLGQSVVAADEYAFGAEVLELWLHRVCLRLCH